MTDQTRARHRNLRRALRANAAFSSICALFFIADSGPIGAFAGVPGPLLIALGFGLLSFAVMLAVTSRRSDGERLRAEARIYCAADLAWVIGSLPVIVLGWLTPAGAMALGAVSAVVLALAIAQWRGIGAAHAVSPAAA